MADTLPETSTSYSDPVYDRLEMVSQTVRRQWYLFAVGLIVVVLAAVGIRMWLQNNPTAASASALVQARGESDPAKRDTALKALAEDGKRTPFFRAVALIDLAQSAIDRNQAGEARELAAKAMAQASASGDDDLQLAARLTQAAAALQGRALSEAESHYQAVLGKSGTRFPARRIDAEIGLARTLAAQGRLDDAIARLEGVVQRNERGGEKLYDFARFLYWTYQRQRAAASATAAVVAPRPPAIAPAATAAPPLAAAPTATGK